MARIHILVTMGILILAVGAVVTALPASASEVGRYEAIQLDATSIFVLDTREGHCWVVNATPSAPSMIYTGQVRPAKKMGETIKPPKEKKD
ncbi:MAG: hypothetical protein ACM3MN_09835 [Nitrospirota bacterium]